jgi:peptide-methionine (S)-S-oxide reductase
MESRSREHIGFGGSCHWCTEAIFLSLKGVMDVHQGWIAADGINAYFSEAVLLTYDPAVISLDTLIAVHLNTHSCTSNHSMRTKYRSAVYTSNEEQKRIALAAIQLLQAEFGEQIITEVLPCKEFKLNTEDFLNYYYSNPEKPFCENIVNPKLRLLMEQFSAEVDLEKLRHLTENKKTSQIAD